MIFSSMTLVLIGLCLQITPVLYLLISKLGLEIYSKPNMHSRAITSYLVNMRYILESPFRPEIIDGYSSSKSNEIFAIFPRIK